MTCLPERDVRRFRYMNKEEGGLVRLWKATREENFLSNWLRVDKEGAHKVFVAVHVNDLIVVASSSQQKEVVSEMKKFFHHENQSPDLFLHRCMWVRGTCVAMVPSGSCHTHTMWRDTVRSGVRPQADTFAATHTV